MSLLSLPPLTSWLASYPNELAHYQAGRSPFRLTCFDAPALQRLSELLDWLRNNDEYHRASRLHYSNQDRQAILQEVRENLQQNNYQHTRLIVRNLKEDQGLQLVSQYRQLCQPLHTAEGWTRQRHTFPESEQEDVIALQQKWQALMPFAFCTSHDLVDKIRILEELDSYEWLLNENFKFLQARLPQPFRNNFFEWRMQFSQGLTQAKQSIATIMLILLQTIATTNDLSCDNLINTSLFPLLKHLKILTPNTKPLYIKSSFNGEQLESFVKFIQKHGTASQQTNLSELPLFQSRSNDNFPLVTVSTLAGGIIRVPQALQTHFSNTSKGLFRWLPLAFRIDRQQQEQCFGMKATYRYLELNQSLQETEQLLGRVQQQDQGSLEVQAQALNKIEQSETNLIAEMKRINAEKPRGLKRLFFGDTARMLDSWQFHLYQHRKQMLNKKLFLAEQMVRTMEEAFSDHQVRLTPTSLKVVHTLFETLPNQLNFLSRNDLRELHRRYIQLNERYQLAAQFGLHFLKQSVDLNQFVYTTSQNAHWKVVKLDRRHIHNWIAAYCALVSEDEANAIRLIGRIIAREEFPSWQAIKEITSPLFRQQAMPDEALNQFLMNLIKNILLPSLVGIQDPAFAFIHTIAPSIAEEWLQEHRTKLESATQLVQHIFNVDGGQELALDGMSDPVWIQGEYITLTTEKALQSIQEICSLSTSAADHTQRLKAAVEFYLQNTPQHPGYKGDNLAYHRLITSIALATGDEQLVVTYGLKRLRFFLAEHRYQEIMTDPFLAEHINLPKLKQCIKHELTELLASPLSDEHIGLIWVLQKWGDKDQEKLYGEQRDQYHFDQIASLLSNDTLSSGAVENFLDYLKSLNESFPQSATGHFELQALFTETLQKSWDVSKQKLITVLGDKETRQAYRLTWLRTLLMQPDKGDECRAYFDYAQSYSDWKEALGEHQITAVHSLIEQFLNQYDHSYPQGLEVVKTLLSSDWITHHPAAQPLANKLAAIEKVCQTQAQHQALAQNIQQQLMQHDFKAVETQLHFLLKQQAYCRTNDAEHYLDSQNTYKAALNALVLWAKQTVFSDPLALCSVQTALLPVLPEGEDKEHLNKLCQSVESIRFAYDQVKVTLHKVVSPTAGDLLSINPAYLNYFAYWPTEKRQMLSEQVDNVLQKSQNNNFILEVMNVFQRLLQNQSENFEADVALLISFLQQQSNRSHHPQSSLARNGGTHEIQNKVESHCVFLLRSIQEGKSWQAEELNELKRYYQLARQLPSSQSFIRKVENTLNGVLRRAVKKLGNPSSWSELSSSNLQLRGNQVAEDCELIRTLGNSNHVKLLDIALKHWLLSYCRLFDPLPVNSIMAKTQYHASLYEQVLLACGNSDQQEIISKLKELRISGQLNNLHLLCNSTLQNLNLSPISNDSKQPCSAQFFKGREHRKNHSILESSGVLSNVRSYTHSDHTRTINSQKVTT